MINESNYVDNFFQNIILLHFIISYIKKKILIQFLAFNEGKKHYQIVRWKKNYTVFSLKYFNHLRKNFFYSVVHRTKKCP